MKIDKKRYLDIVRDLNIGNSVAENDQLLEHVKVETPIFKEILNNKYDIIPGRKGAGKTAIFKMLEMRKDDLLQEKNIVILTGVNSNGEPIFKHFKNEFSNFNEDDFENFWKLYFISLIYNDFIKNELYEAGFVDCISELRDFKSACAAADLSEILFVGERRAIIESIFNFIKITKISLSEVVDSEKPSVLQFKQELSFGPATEKNKSRPIYVNEIGEKLKSLTEKSGFKIWIILDRLDETFDRFSQTEFNGLRGLLHAYRSFDIGDRYDLFKIKLFLRDDVKLFLTDEKIFKTFFAYAKMPPLTAATHIFSKEAPTLCWTEHGVERLILNRLLASRELRDYVGMTKKIGDLRYELLDKGIYKELSDKAKRFAYWKKIFPSTIKSSATLKWIYTRLKDSNNVVTPRSVIDMLEGAINYQKNRIISKGDALDIISADSLKIGLECASKNKLRDDLFNEFPMEQENIKKLEKERKHKLNTKDLQKMYGDKWTDVVESLNRMGILRPLKNSEEYAVTLLFRPALGIPYKY